MLQVSNFAVVRKSDEEVLLDTLVVTHQRDLAEPKAQVMIPIALLVKMQNLWRWLSYAGTKRYLHRASVNGEIDHPGSLLGVSFMHHQPKA